MKQKIVQRGLGVSARAPAWGATAEILDTSTPMQFQSAPLHEGRHMLHTLATQAIEFQSAPLHERRLPRRSVTAFS